EDLELPRLAPALAAPKLVCVGWERLARVERRERAILRDEELPAFQPLADLVLVAAVDADLDVRVDAGLTSGEEVERPTAGDSPRHVQATQKLGDLLGRERL